MSWNPIDDPSGGDRFAIDGTPCPGVTTITNGGERDLNWQKQQGVLTVGASTILRYEEIAEVTYQVRLHRREEFVAFDQLADKLNSGVDVRPPKAWILSDNRLKHCRIAAVSLRKIGPLQRVARGGPWDRTVAFIAYKKPKPLGGAPAAPQNAIEKAIEDLSKQNAALNAQIDAAQKAARAGK